MEILLADVMGFCFGVRRAIELAEASLRDGHTVHTLGPLVHNSQEIARLDAAGIRAIDSPAEVTGDTVVIRAHGARPEMFAELRQRDLAIVDATCPFVKKSHRLVREFARDGLLLVIVGHPDHPEVQGIRGYASGPSYVISRSEDVAVLPADIRPGILAQTTVNEQHFLEVVEALLQRYPEAKVCNTVCSATRERQEAVLRLAARVDAVYVIGGRNSSNANRLTEICRHACPKTYLDRDRRGDRSARHAGVRARRGDRRRLHARLADRASRTAPGCHLTAVPKHFSAIPRRRNESIHISVRVWRECGIQEATNCGSKIPEILNR